MSTIQSYQAQCALCGKKSKQTEITSYSNFGYPDLDFRPPSMCRETMDYWVSECPHCGFVNTDLSEQIDLLPEEISILYKDIESRFDWKRTRYDTGANIPLRFAKLGAMLAESDDYEGAVEQFLRVAWNFDDDRDEQSAKYWRKVAIKLAELLLFDYPQKNPSDKIICIYADMLRRTGNFKTVIRLFDNIQIYDEEFFMMNEHITMREHLHRMKYYKKFSEQGYRLIKFQKELTERGDQKTHTTDEVFIPEDEVDRPEMFYIFPFKL